jgi:hypothetical protein
MRPKPHSFRPRCEARERLTRPLEAIDDPNGGWKSRGIWASAGNRTPFHVEGGKGTLPKLVKFQLRPDPLAH